MKSRRWVFGVIGAYFLLLCMALIAVVTVDPYFHFHAPLDGISYKIGSAQYVNDGITKHFDYDAIITGASTTKCFSTAVTNELFDVESVRLTFLGEGFKRINDNLEAAIKTHPDLKVVIRGIDTLFFITDENWMGYDSYPDYLYDDDLWNDVYYVFNGDVLFNEVFPELIRTWREEPIENFDASLYQAPGREAALAAYSRPEKEEKVIDEAETKEIFLHLDRQLQENVVKTIEENPDITFYLFFPPYSILWWDENNQSGQDVLLRRIQMEKFAIEKLIPYENVHLFSFNANFEWICNLDNYGDEVHYAEAASTQMLEWMKAGEYELTEDNYLEYIDSITEFLCNYDYDALF